MASKTDEYTKQLARYREVLEGLTVKQLIKDYATPLQIVGRHDMKKAELVDAILANSDTAVPSDNNNDTAVEENVVEEVKAEKTVKKGVKLTDVQIQNKLRYVENMEIGTIVAFKLPGMKVKSAKVIRKSTKNRKFKVETAYGAEFVINFEDVIWVKTNKRWPKGVYNLLKGNELEGV